MKTKILDSKKLFKKAWKNFSLYIRKVRDVDKYGLTNCFTCGKRGDYRDFDAGHLFHGTYTPIYFDPYNVNSQCPRCNKYLSGNLAVYSAKVIEKYGIEKFQELMIKKDLIKRYSILELLEIIKKYESS